MSYVISSTFISVDSTGSGKAQGTNHKQKLITIKKKHSEFEYGSTIKGERTYPCFLTYRGGGFKKSITMP